MDGTSTWDSPSWELVCLLDLSSGTANTEISSLNNRGWGAMRKIHLIAIGLAACALPALSVTAQETAKTAPTAASTTPTIDQSLEWKGAFNPKISPDGKRVVYELQKTNWEDNAFERNLWIVEIASG